MHTAVFTYSSWLHQCYDGVVILVYICGRETHVLTCTFSTWFAHARTHYFRILIVHESIYVMPYKMMNGVSFWFSCFSPEKSVWAL